MPNLKIVVSTTTTTAMGELQKRLPPHIGRIYYPMDSRRCVSRALGTIRPEAVGLIESEIWPNFIWRARDLGTPLFLINARLSERSYPRYRRLGFLFRSLFASFSVVGAQNQEDANRLLSLGCSPDAVHVVGNLKFDAAKFEGKSPFDVQALLGQLGVAKDAPVIVAGSTHAGEERLLAEMLVRLRPRFPNLFLVLVPRHFERAREVADDLKASGVQFINRTEITPDTRLASGSLPCLLVNTTGELRFFYEAATVVFVGKSLAGRGGQNPIEPAALGKPVLFGPHMQNFPDIVRILLAQDGAVQVHNAAELEAKLAELLSGTGRRDELGRNALKIVRENQGAVTRTVDLIVKQLEMREVYSAPQS
jgi:3-deoxy-D-manno-octulosonic-acid transferase